MGSDIDGQVGRAPRSAVAVALALASVPLTAQGLSRFAYSLLLPIMRRDLSWSFSTAGAMNTANGIGYLAGALAAVTTVRHLGTRRSLRVAMLGLIATLALSASTSNVLALFAIRLLTGVSAGVAFVVGAATVTHLSARSPARSALLVGLYFGGVGAGIVASGLIIPPLESLLPTDGSVWRAGWLTLAAGGLITLPAVWCRFSLLMGSSGLATSAT